MTSRLGTREQRDAEHRAAHPYDCLLKLSGTSGEWMWGRFKTPERAHEEGMKAVFSDLPFGRRCRSYRVVDARTGRNVPAEQPAQAA